MERLDKLKFTEKVSANLTVEEDLKVWDHFWFVDIEEEVLYMTENLWTNHTEACNSGITRIKLAPSCYNRDQVYTMVSTAEDNGKAFLISLYNDKNIGYTLK